MRPKVKFELNIWVKVNLNVSKNIFDRISVPFQICNVFLRLNDSDKRLNTREAKKNTSMTEKKS